MAKKVKNTVEIIADLPLIGFGLPTSEGQTVEVSEELASEIVTAKYGRYADDKVAEQNQKALHEENAELKAKVLALETANAELQAKIAELQEPAK
jgi:hypothetical protein